MNEDAATEVDYESDSLRIVRRLGDTVVRRTGWWSPAVHALLRHLERVGFPESVRVLGLDDDGNELLAHIDGISSLGAWARIVPEAGLREYARLIRRYHDAVRDYVPDPDAEWMTERHPLRSGEIVTHGDVGPWNTVWRGGAVVGLLDWDLAGPRPPLHDVAYALEYTAPFRGDEAAATDIGFVAPPDRGARIRVFAEAYGIGSLGFDPAAPGFVDAMIDAVIAEQEATLRDTVALAERGLQPHVAWLAEGFVDEQLARIAWTREHRHLFR